MKRFHAQFGAENFDAPIVFCTGLFAAASPVAKPDHGKWMLGDTQVNFLISQNCGAVMGIEHIGGEAGASRGALA